MRDSRLDVETRTWATYHKFHQQLGHRASLWSLHSLFHRLFQTIHFLLSLRCSFLRLLQQHFLDGLVAHQRGGSWIDQRAVQSLTSLWITLQDGVVLVLVNQRLAFAALCQRQPIEAILDTTFTHQVSRVSADARCGRHVDCAQGGGKKKG